MSDADSTGAALALLTSLFFLPFLLAYVLATFVVAYVASEKGRRGLAWWALSLFLSPLLALLALAALPNERRDLPKL